MWYMVYKHTPSASAVRCGSERTPGAATCSKFAGEEKEEQEEHDDTDREGGWGSDEWSVPVLHGVEDDGGQGGEKQSSNKHEEWERTAT